LDNIKRTSDLNSKILYLSKGVFVSELSYFSSLYPDIAKKYFNEVAIETIAQGMVLFIPNNTKIDRFINLKEIVENFSDTEKRLFVIVGSFACVKIYNFIENLEKFIHSIDFFVEEGASVSFIGCYLDFDESKIITHDLNIFLIEKNCKVDCKIFCIVDGVQNIVFRTKQQHLSGDSHSNLILNCIAFENSHFEYEGKIFIDKNCSKVEAYQNNKNIILENNVVVNSMPILEILSNDVLCKHSTATGQIDKDSLFYLQTRGLSEKEANILLLENVFDFLINSFDNKKIKDTVLRRVKEKIRKIL